jgi:hypothetical protein
MGGLQQTPLSIGYRIRAQLEGDILGRHYPVYQQSALWPGAYGPPVFRKVALPTPAFACALGRAKAGRRCSYGSEQIV